MEDHRHDLVLIAAGYTEPMQGFLGMNPGLRSRFRCDLLFEDYAPAEMVAILHHLAAECHYELPADADTVLRPTFQSLWDHRDKDFANARDVCNLFEHVLDEQANRLGAASDISEAEVSKITLTDLVAAARTLGFDTTPP